MEAKPEHVIALITRPAYCAAGGHEQLTKAYFSLDGQMTLCATCLMRLAVEKIVPLAQVQEALRKRGL